MPKKITVKKILILNPNIDRHLLKKALELSQALQRAGTVRRSYNLISPYSQRNTPVSQKDEPHSRTVSVGH